MTCDIWNVTFHIAFLCFVNYILEKKESIVFISRPGVAGAVLQSPWLLTDSFVHQASDPLVPISSKHYQSQTGRARELKF